MTWRQLAHLQNDAALYLNSGGSDTFARAVCGRAYYAAYAAVTHYLIPLGITFGRGWQNPQHAWLPTYVDRLTDLSHAERRAVSRALRRLRQRREDADYRPGITLDRTAARESLRDAAEVFRYLQKVE